MKKQGNNVKMLIAANALSVLLILSVLFSAVFPIVESKHDCHGEDCPICSSIAMCENTMRILGDGDIAQIFAVVQTLFLLVLSVSFAADQFLQATPVSKKVRLNN